MDKGILRRLSWPAEKRQRFYLRYIQWLDSRLSRHGIGPEISYEEQLANKKMQIAIQRENEYAGI